MVTCGSRLHNELDHSSAVMPVLRRADEWSGAYLRVAGQCQGVLPPGNREGNGVDLGISGFVF